jgi:hypothetical protein
MDTSSFPGIKQLGFGVDLPPRSIAEVKGRIIYFYASSVFSWQVIR